MFIVRRGAHVFSIVDNVSQNALVRHPGLD